MTDLEPTPIPSHRAPDRARRRAALRGLAFALLAALLLTAPTLGQATAKEADRDLTMAKPSEVGMDPAKLAELNDAMEALVDSGGLSGVISVVARHGKIVHYQIYGDRDLEAGAPMERDTIFRIYSMTKPIAGVALMTLWEDGKFQLDDPVEKYLPALANLQVAVADGPDGQPELAPADHPMTIRELMSHTGGLTYGIFGRSQVDLLYQKANILDRDQTLEEFVEKLSELPLLHQPGTQWQYSVSVDVQGRLIEVLSGMSFDEYLKKEVFEPLGMEDTDFSVPEAEADRLATLYVPDREGKLQPQTSDDVLVRPTFLSGGGGLVSTTDDYLRFAQMLLNGGELDGVRILKPETVELMASNQLPKGLEEISPMFAGNQFGLDFALVTDPNERTDHPRAQGEFWWFGIGGTWFGINPNEDLIVLGMIQNRGGRAATQARIQSKKLAYEAIVD